MARNRNRPATSSQREAERHTVELQKTLASASSRASPISGSRRSASAADLLMIFLIGVDAPQIVLLSKHQIAYCQHAGEHGMVLVIVAMQAHCGRWSGNSPGCRRIS